MKCPICENGTLKKGEKLVYCSERKLEKVGTQLVDKGCKFKVIFDQKKVFGSVITPIDVKNLVAGQTLISSKNHKMVLDLANKDFFTKITFAEKIEDEDL